MEGANFGHANLTKIQTFQCTFDKCNFRGANLTNAFFCDNSSLRECNLVGANLTGMVLGDFLFNSIYNADTILNEQDINANFFNPFNCLAYLDSGEDLSSMNLEGFDLSKLDLSEINFSHANLKRANLSNSILFQVNLEGANLEDADLTNADLEEANLELACLINANLMGTILAENT